MNIGSLLFGLIFLALFFHAVQWYLQVKALGGTPIWFKFFKKSEVVKPPKK